MLRPSFPRGMDILPYGGYPSTEDRLIGTLPSVSDESIQAILEAMREQKAVSLSCNHTEAIGNAASQWVAKQNGKPGTFAAQMESSLERPGFFFRRTGLTVRTTARIVTT